MRLIHGSAHDIPLPDASVQCIVTSPPYFGLRAYAGEQDIEWPAVTYAPMPGLPPITIPGCDPECDHEWGAPLPTVGKVSHGTGNSTLSGGHESWGNRDGGNQGSYCAKCGGWRGGLGLEPDINAYIGHLILCLREWRRVLRDDGTCFVNLGDSFYGGKGANGSSKARNTAEERGYKQSGGTVLMDTRPLDIPQAGLKPKDLCGIPWRFAFAAQADGWYLRSDIIWAKPNPMPESVTDRPTRSHEYVFLLAKEPRYYYDADAVREDAISNGNPRFRTSEKYIHQPRAVADNHRGGLPELSAAIPAGRNLRSVWTIPTQPTRWRTLPPTPNGWSSRASRRAHRRMGAARSAPRRG